MASARNIHVLHVMPTLRPGGMELALARVVNALAEEGMRHSVIALTGDSDKSVELPQGTDVYHLHAKPNDPLLPWRLWRLIGRIQPTVIHGRNWPAWPDVALARLARSPAPPLVFSFHGQDRPGPMPLRRRIASRILTSVTSELFTVSQASKRLLVEHVGLPAGRIDVIPNGVDMSRFAPRQGQRPPGPIAIGSVGSLKAVKNHSLLISACARLRADGADVVVRIAGEGPDRERLAGLADSLGVASHVHLPGHVDDVPAFLQGLDIFVLPSDSEAHPNALLEAMACGLPCVATRVGGVGEVLAEGQFGRLIEPGDVGGLASVLKELFDDSQARHSLGRAGRERCAQRYSLREMIDSYRELYRRLSVPESMLTDGGSERNGGPPRVAMFGPLPPACGGMATVTAGLRDGELADSCRLTVINNAKTTPDDRTILEGIRAQWRLLGRVWSAMGNGAQLAHIHTCSGLTFWRDCLHALVARARAKRTILHIHGGYFDEFAGSLGPLARRLLRAALEASSAVIVLGEGWTHRLRRFAPRANWRAVPNGVSLPELPARSHDTDQTTFLFLGDLSEAKGVYDLVSATALACAEGFRGQVLLAGREVAPEGRAELTRRIDEADCGEHVKILGELTRQQTADALASADCLVLPSHAEGMPLAILEAMSFALPVIATKVGAVPEVINDGGEGLLVAPGDVTALAACMVRLAGDRQLRRQMGQAGRLRVEQRYSLSAMAADVRQVYADVLSGWAR